MIDGSLKSILDNDKISKALISNSTQKINGEKRVYIISDHCDIRKPYSKNMENLGKVRDLNSNIINGFTSLGSVILDENKKELTLLTLAYRAIKNPPLLQKKNLMIFIIIK